MTDTKHTPGPWWVLGPPQDNDKLPWVVLSWRNDAALHVVETCREGDARLIAAAPELLCCIRELLADSSALPMETVERARAAIAKAEGGE